MAKVTCVDQSGAALKLLSEKNQFDLVMIDGNMSDVDTLTFLRLTKPMDVLAVVMSEEENEAFMHEVFKSGAFRVVKRPFTIDAVRHIRQDVVRERILANEKWENRNIEIQDNGSSGGRKKVKPGPRKRVHPLSDDDFDDDDDVEDADCTDDVRIMRKKICVEWTDELHEKFLLAVHQLGEGRCFPKKILELMDVPGLTRMQVASHLQKCRKENVNFYGKKTPQNHASPSNISPQPLSERKFGCMPTLQKDHEENNTLIGINLPINGWQTTEVNRTKNRTYKAGSSLLNISNQKNIAQRIEYTQIPFGNDQEKNQDDGFGSRITQAKHNFFQQTISGVRDVGQGSNDHNLPSIRRQSSEEFPEFLKDLDGNGPNDM
ncbi:two-component response regulator ORR21-like [Bidens hawaiensis]|uniref:two-component response regulator ORR21-like n=1 Tax=Bidens hawaiensis TaxID=980011 RepID=UPI00404B4397